MGENKKREKVFQFKQFAVRNELSAMKVGTDGVLLGAWTHVEGAKSVLDIGTGCGLIALMIAQRNTEAQITGIDISHDAIKEAKENALASPWRDRITMLECDFNHAIAHKLLGDYDLVVSNPPYFTSTITAPNENRALARHCSTLDYSDIIKACSGGLLTEGGVLSLISPTDRIDDIIFSAEMSHMKIISQVNVSTKYNSAPSRVLWEITHSGNGQRSAPIETLQIYKDAGIYSDEYRSLIQDFYLHF